MDWKMREARQAYLTQRRDERNERQTEHKQALWIKLSLTGFRF